MSSHDDRWWDIQAAEYVLGTLSEPDRAVFKKLLRTDPDVQQRVLEWETRLDPLHRSTQPVQPSDGLYERILTGINKQANDKGDQSSDLVSLTEWREHVRFWRTISAASMAIAAALAFFVVLNPAYLQTPDTDTSTSDLRFTTVTVLENESGEPIWAISYIPQSIEPESTTPAEREPGQLVVSAIGQIPLQEDQSHQLWMVLSDESGVQSVGLMPNEPGDSKILDLPVELSDANQFAVSLEPFGGVPGPNHGPVIAINPIIPPADSI